MLVIKFSTATLTAQKLENQKNNKNLDNRRKNNINKNDINKNSSNNAQYQKFILKNFKNIFTVKKCVNKISQHNAVLEMVTKKIIKNWLGKNLTKSYLLTGKTHEGLL